ncbi:MAG: TIM barrel protein [Candidatus Berkelbacteria bacterium]|nr:TIM barrel protein [Candidatus Berkelbacteria bacterium]
MILLSTGSLYNYGLNRVFEMAKKADFAGLELMLGFNMDLWQPHYLNKLKAKYKLATPVFHYTMFSNYMAQLAKDRFLLCLEYAEKMKAEVLVVHPCESSEKDFSKWFFVHIKAIQRKTEVKIAVENMPVKESDGDKYVKKYYNPLELKSKFDYLCLDTTHLATTQYNLLDIYPKIQDKLVHVHISDSKETDVEKAGVSHMIPGTGSLPLDKLLQTLEQDHYQYHVGLEMFLESLEYKDDKKVLINLKKARDFVTKYFEYKR